MIETRAPAVRRVVSRHAWMVLGLWTGCAGLTDPVPAVRTPARTVASQGLERVTTAVPWPRGMAWVDGNLVVLARGRHRRSGGVSADIADHAGSLFRVDPGVSELVTPGQGASAQVRANGQVFATPSAPPFFLWDRLGEPVDDTRMDRPYCTLAYDADSQNFFLCGYSGVDLPGAKFRKNATDTVHRFDRRAERWFVVEAHDPSVVPDGALTGVVPNQHYPHHVVAANPPPHGWLNGADGATVVDEYLYVVAKDNHVLAQYDLAEVRRNPDAPPPSSRVVMGQQVRLSEHGRVREAFLSGHSAVAAQGGFLYVGYRTSSVVIRLPLDESGDLVRPLRAELIACFQPFDEESGQGANLIDMAFNSKGELFVSCASKGRVWNVGVPDPDQVFLGDDSRPEQDCSAAPYVDLPALSGNPKARIGNILFDPQDRLYLCSGNYDAGTELAGVVYRVEPQDMPSVGPASLASGAP